MRTYEWIRRFRKEKTGLSCRGFAKVIDIDCGNYSKYETGKLLPGDDFLDRFEIACSLSEVEKELLFALRSCDRMLQLTIREDER